MCAQYLIKIKLKELKEKFGIVIPEGLKISEVIDERVLPHRFAPVLVGEGDKMILKLMNFSLIPSWSKERKVKFATHNARLETLAEKPTWKKPFESQHALVPLTRFVEPIYENELAGNMVQFFEKSGELLFAAALYDRWKDVKTGEVVDSFSIITTEPPEFIAKAGHDRCPLFLKREAWGEWLSSQRKQASELTQFLKQHEMNFDFGVEIDRPLAPGWEKRA